MKMNVLATTCNPKKFGIYMVPLEPLNLQWIVRKVVILMCLMIPN